MWKIILIMLLIIILFVCLMHEENHHLSVTKYTIKSNRIPKVFDKSKFVLISDLHNNSFGKDNEVLIRRIKEENPDYILISGDMLIGHNNSDYYPALNLLITLSENYPIYYVNGNHEQRLEESEEAQDLINEYKDILIANGIHFVNNKTIELVKDNEAISITGLVIDSSYYKKVNRPEMTLGQIESKIGLCENDRYHILLAHNPMYFEFYAEWGADLVLAGHVHGGIMRLPYLGGVISPQYILFPKYDSGRFESGKSTMLLSRGLGVHTLKVRIFNRPELVIFTLNKE